MTSSIPSFLSNKFISNLYWTAKFLTLYAPIPQNGGQHTQTVRRQSDVSTEWLNLIKWDALRDLVSFVQFKKRENTLGGVLLLVKLQAREGHVNFVEDIL